METALSALMKEVGEALKLDDDNQEKEAYKKYVECVHKIVNNLVLRINLAGGNVVVSSNTVRQVKLAQQCVDRVVALLDKMDTNQSSSLPSTRTGSQTIIHNTSQVSSTVMPSPVTPVPDPAQDSIVNQPTQPEDPSSNSQQSWRLNTPVPSLPAENTPHVFTVSKNRQLTPTEIAHKQNQSLLTAYKARMNRLNRADFNAFSYSLTIQRKMAENLAIAQAQEEELARKMQARNQRMEEAAARRFASAAMLGMSSEEQEQRQNYKKILAYENDAKWLQNWRKKLEMSPEDPVLISQLVQEILRCADHPFTTLLRKYQFSVYQRLYPLVLNKNSLLDRVQVPLPQEFWSSSKDVEQFLRKKSRHASQISPKEKDIECDTGTSERRSTESDQGSNGENEDKKGEDSEVKTAIPGCDITNKDSRIDSNPENWMDPLMVNSESGKTAVEKKHFETVDEGDAENKSLPERVVQDKTENIVQEEGENISGSREIQGPECEDLRHDKARCAEGDVEENVEKITMELAEEDSASSSHVPDQNEETLCEREARSGSECSSTVDVEHMVAESQRDLNLALEKGEILQAQLSWERKQAQLLMRQVTQDYGNYDQANFDDLFDSDDEDNEADETGANRASESDTRKTETAFSFDHVRKTPAPKKEGIVGDGASSSATHGEQSQVKIGRSASHQPSSTNQVSMIEDSHNFRRSLDTSVDRVEHVSDEQLTELNNEAYGRHLKSIAEDIHSYLEKLLVMMIIAYEGLDTPVGRDQCAVSLEEPFFKPIWKTLLQLFRVVNAKQELALATVMTQYSDASLQDLKVSKKFQLTSLSPEEQPYQLAITELRRVPEYYTMLCKLDCVVKVCRQICECVDGYYSSQGNEGVVKPGKKAPSLGADDLLPVLSYVVIHSATPQLVSECQAMTEFIHEGYMMGQEGYCLTTLRTALDFVTSLLSHPLSPS